ncbi:MAG: exo-alpha-sialidase [Deltaproteobacteria bacterium]|nr:exo-alpha-sialidase [Deltaproteobacteria bacterium]
MRVGRISSAGALALLLAIGPSGCSTGDETTTEASDLAHVHGLGVNPADGKVYTASHHGVFRIDDGGAVRQGDLGQDTMGFTVAGADRFLASGHPDPSKDRLLGPGMRPLLGLIESTDRGGSWRSLSLLGEVDFHSLAYAHGRVYGFDATNGRFMVSADAKQWETRSNVRLASFAVSPSSPDRVVASLADQSLVVSVDGGRSWQSVSGGLPLAFISWHPVRGLWALEASGVVARSTDDGSTWTRVGKVTGSPAALLADANGLFVATSDAVLLSTDAAGTWTKIHPR